MLNYIAMIVACSLGMAILDNDRTSVSLEEWAIYAVMLYATWRLVNLMIQYVRDHEGGI